MYPTQIVKLIVFFLPFSETDFGCCPDNVTAARGQDFLGCGCTHSPYGCCNDQVTVAPENGVENCPCHTSEFGCCPDGQSTAQGPKLEGDIQNNNIALNLDRHVFKHW